MDTVILVQVVIFSGTVITAIAGAWSIWVQTKQKASKDTMDAQLLQQQQRLEDIKELRERIDEQDERIESMGRKLDRVSRELRTEQSLTHRMALAMQTHDNFLDLVSDYFTLHKDTLPQPIPRIPNRERLKDLIRLATNRDRGDPLTE